MLRKILLIIILLNSVNLFAQKGKHNTLSKKHGILIFEGEGNRIYNMFFVETSINKLALLFNKMDTIKAISLGTPGDDASAVMSYKEYLSKSFTFDSLSYITIIDDDGLYIEYFYTINYTSGYINYTKSKVHKFKKQQYEKRKINGRVIHFDLEYFIPINSFEANKPPIFKKSIRRKYKKK